MNKRIEMFIEKFGKDNYDHFIKAKDRLKREGHSTDVTFYVKNKSIEDFIDILLSVYDSENDVNTINNILGITEEMTGEYKYYGTINGYAVYEPLDYVSAVHFGNNTRWCTSGRYNNQNCNIDYGQAKRCFTRYTKEYNHRLIYFNDPKTLDGQYAVEVLEYAKRLYDEEYINQELIYSTNIIIYNSNDYHEYNINIVEILNKIKDKLHIDPTIKTYQTSVSQNKLDEAFNQMFHGKQEDISNICNALSIDSSIIQHINIPDNVTTLSRNALCKMDIVSINLNNVTTIEDCAFEYCNKLQTINLDNVQHIGRHAFICCNKLTTINLKNIQRIESNAFMFCEQLHTINNINNKAKIQITAFAGCKSLTKQSRMNIMNHVDLLNDDLFNDCDSLL